MKRNGASRSQGALINMRGRKITGSSTKCHSPLWNGIIFLSISFSFITLTSIKPVSAAAADDNHRNRNDDLIQGFSLGPEMATTEFDYSIRGDRKFGDKCDTDMECGFPHSTCDSKKKSCQCVEDRPVTNHIDKCGKVAAVNESCTFNEQCEAFNFQTECRDGRCICRYEMSPVFNKEGRVECKVTQESREPGRYIDPAMIGILAGMALMFIIICVVLRLFSKPEEWTKKNGCSSLANRNLPASFWNSNYIPPVPAPTHHQVPDLYSTDGSYTTDPWVPHAAHYGSYAHAAHAHAAQAHAYHHNMAQYGSLLRLPQHYGHSSRLHHDQQAAHALESAAAYSSYPTMAGLEAQVQESSKDLYWF